MKRKLAIQADKLVRDFKTTRAVDNLDLQIKRGELFGLIGPDGAGKTTTLRLLAGLLGLSGGSAKVLGYDLAKEAEDIKPHIGYMAQQFSLYGELSVLENLLFFAEIYEVNTKKLQARVERLLAFAGLSQFTDRRAEHLSGGMQKKLALACTLIHEPKLLLLDEPTTGVDPVSRREFWNILADLHLKGATIVVSTPYMDEADRCSRVGLMYEGKLIISDTPQKLRAQVEGELIEITMKDWRGAKKLLAQVDGIMQIQSYGDRLHVFVDSADRRIPQIEKYLKKENFALVNIRQAPTRMEEAFISLMQEMEK